MFTTKFEKSGTFKKPGFLGRSVRLILGIPLFGISLYTLIHYNDVVYKFPENPLIWLGFALCLFFMNDIVNIGFKRNWKHWPQTTFIAAMLIASVWSFLQYKTIWGPPLGILTYLFVVYATGHLGLSHILAGLLALPG